jgi:uncharacterized protein
VRVVLDTNVSIAALIKPGSSNDLLVRHWLRGTFTLLTSTAQIEELRRVSRQERHVGMIRRKDAGKLVNRLRSRAEIVEVRRPPTLSPDPDDNAILAIALEGRADYLASLNMDHVVKLEKVGKTRILHARDLLERLS